MINNLRVVVILGFSRLFCHFCSRQKSTTNVGRQQNTYLSCRSGRRQFYLRRPKTGCNATGGECPDCLAGEDYRPAALCTGYGTTAHACWGNVSGLCPAYPESLRPCKSGVYPIKRIGDLQGHRFFSNSMDYLPARRL